MNVPHELVPVIEWWQKDGKKTAAIAAVGAIIALGIYGWNAKQAKFENEAADIAYKAAFQSMGVEELEGAAESYESSKAASAIKLFLAKAYAARGEAGDLEKAVAIYEGLINASNKPEAFAGLSEMGLASCYETLGRWEDAKKLYEAGTNGFYFSFDAKLGAARCVKGIEGVDKAVAQLESLKKDVEGVIGATMKIDAAIDAVKRWEKRAAPAPAPAPAAIEAKPAAENKFDASKVTLAPEQGAAKKPETPSAKAK